MRLSFALSDIEIGVFKLEPQLNAIIIEPCNAFAQQLQYQLMRFFFKMNDGDRVKSLIFLFEPIAQDMSDVSLHLVQQCFLHIAVPVNISCTR